MLSQLALTVLPATVLLVSADVSEEDSPPPGQGRGVFMNTPFFSRYPRAELELSRVLSSPDHAAKDPTNLLESLFHFRGGSSDCIITTTMSPLPPSPPSSPGVFRLLSPFFLAWLLPHLSLLHSSSCLYPPPWCPAD